MDEMEFFQTYELRPTGFTENALDIWKRDSGIYGKIGRCNASEFQVHVGSQYVGKRATFGAALKLFIRHV
jgi:hypothetical protein